MTPPTFRLDGLKPLPYDSRDRQFATYRTPLVSVPANFGHYAEITPGTWGMLDNDQYGDCFPAGQGHAVMQYSAEGGHAVTVAPAETLADYFSMNGVKPGQPGSASDQGTDPRAGLQYHKNVGMLAIRNERHKLAGYVSLEVGNLDELAEAAYLFGVAGIGINCPQSAQDQFPSGYWRVIPGSPVEGGHWIVCVGRWHGYYEIVTWGRRIHVTAAFLEKYMTCAFGMLSPEIIGGAGKSPEGFAYQQLSADLGLI